RAPPRRVMRRSSPADQATSSGNDVGDQPKPQTHTPVGGLRAQCASVGQVPLHAGASAFPHGGRVVVGVDVVLVVGVGGSAVTRVPTQVSTRPSTLTASPTVAQPPFASAFWNASTNFCSAFVRQAGSTAVFTATAFSWHAPFALAFLKAALSLATA